MSSPFRPLSPKRDSIFNSRSSSPLKSKPSTPAKNHAQAQNIRKIPKLGANLTPCKKQGVLGFQIYEDKPEEYELYHKSRDDETNIMFSHDDKENILQPKVLSLQQNRYSPRKPLANLDIRKFAGSAVSAGQISRYPSGLTQLYQPPNYDNESKTAHKFSALPSFVTPPRNAMKQILHRSQDANENEDEYDDLELRLIAKSQEVARRKRSMSVGVNKGKKHLVQKPRFSIYTN